MLAAETRRGHQQRLDGRGDRLQQRRALGSLEEMAAIVAFLESDDSTFVFRHGLLGVAATWYRKAAALFLPNSYQGIRTAPLER
jgi:hypothetical protein